MFSFLNPKKIKLILFSLSLLAIVLTACVFAMFRLPEPPNSVSSAFVLSNMTVVNPGIQKKKVKHLEVASGRLIFGGQDQTLQSAKSNVDNLKQYQGMYILPGLVNMHSHSASKNILQLPPMFSLAAVMHGVTTWRDAIDADGTGVPALREQINDGAWPTPEVHSCAVITSGQARWPNSNIVDDLNQIPELVKSLKEAGHVCIKSYENLSIEMISKIKFEANRHDMQVIGHVPEGLTIEQAWLPDTQHFFGVQTDLQYGVVNRNGNWGSVDDDRINSVANLIASRNMINTPTLITLQQLQEYRDYSGALQNASYRYIPSFFQEIVWHPQKGLPVYRDLKAKTLDRAADALAKKLQLLKRLDELDATLNIGTDTQQPFVVPGISMWQEMRLFERAGIDAERIWAHATWKSHQQLPGGHKKLIEEGAEATFLIFENDPTVSLDHLGSLKAVVLRGKLYDIDELKGTMRKLQHHYDSWPLSLVSEFFVERALEKVARRFTH